jgi:hypothetical protein
MNNTRKSNTSVLEEEEPRAAEAQNLRQEIKAARGIPERCLGNGELMEKAIAAMVPQNPFASGEWKDQERAQAWEGVLEAFTQLCKRSHSRVRDNGKLRTVSNRAVRRLFNDYCVETYGGECYADDFVCYLAEEYLDALRERRENSGEELNAPLVYARFVVWTALNRWVEQVKEDRREEEQAQAFDEQMMKAVHF